MIAQFYGSDWHRRQTIDDSIRLKSMLITCIPGMPSRSYYWAVETATGRMSTKEP